MQSLTEKNQLSEVMSSENGYGREKRIEKLWMASEGER